MSGILQSFKKDWWRWTPAERIGAVLSLGLGLALILALVVAGAAR